MAGLQVTAIVFVVMFLGPVVVVVVLRIVVVLRVTVVFFAAFDRFVKIGGVIQLVGVRFVVRIGVRFAARFGACAACCFAWPLLAAFSCSSSSATSSPAPTRTERIALLAACGRAAFGRAFLVYIRPGFGGLVRVESVVVARRFISLVQQMLAVERIAVVFEIFRARLLAAWFGRTPLAFRRFAPCRCAAWRFATCRWATCGWATAFVARTSAAAAAATATFPIAGLVGRALAGARLLGKRSVARFADAQVLDFEIVDELGPLIVSKGLILGKGRPGERCLGARGGFARHLTLRAVALAARSRRALTAPSLGPATSAATATAPAPIVAPARRPVAPRLLRRQARAGAVIGLP